MKNVRIFEEYFIKIDNQGSFSGTLPFRIDSDTGKLHKTIESNANKNTFFLTYDEYLKLERLNDAISKKCELLDRQKKTTIAIFQTAIRKIMNDRPFDEKIKKYNL